MTTSIHQQVEWNQIIQISATNNNKYYGKTWRAMAPIGGSSINKNDKFKNKSEIQSSSWLGVLEVEIKHRHHLQKECHSQFVACSQIEIETFLIKFHLLIFLDPFCQSIFRRLLGQFSKCTPQFMVGNDK